LMIELRFGLPFSVKELILLPILQSLKTAPGILWLVAEKYPQRYPGGQVQEIQNMAALP